MSEQDLVSEARPEKKEESTAFLVGLGLLLISGFFFVGSFFIPAPEGLQTAPGMLPMILGGSLFVMSAVITWDTVRRGALRNLFNRRKGAKEASEHSIRRALIAIAAVAVFYFGLLQFLPFEIAAFIFLIVMTQVFWEESTLFRRLSVSLLVPLLVSGCFQGIFGIPLPGKESLVQTFMFWLKH